MMTTKKEGLDWRVVCTGIACLAGYGIYAASQGINGHLMSLIAVIIGLAIGIKIPDFIKSK